MWPNYRMVGEKCKIVFDDFKNGKDITKYRTNGTEDWHHRSRSPKKALGKTSSTPVIVPIEEKKIEV